MLRPIKSLANRPLEHPPLIGGHALHGRIDRHCLEVTAIDRIEDPDFPQVPRVIADAKPIHVDVVGRHFSPQGHQIVARVEHSAQFDPAGREGPIGMFGQKHEQVIGSPRKRRGVQGSTLLPHLQPARLRRGVLGDGVDIHQVDMEDLQQGLVGQ